MKRREKRRRGEMKLGMNRREETRESQRQEDSLEAADSKRGVLARLTQGEISALLFGSESLRHRVRL